MNVKCLTLGMLNWQVKLMILINFCAYSFNIKFPIFKLNVFEKSDSRMADQAYCHKIGNAVHKLTKICIKYKK